MGREIDACVGRFLDGMPRKCPVAEGDVGMQGCLLELSDENPRSALSIESVDYRENARTEISPAPANKSKLEHPVE